MAAVVRGARQRNEETKLGRDGPSEHEPQPTVNAAVQRVRVCRRSLVVDKPLVPP